MEEKNILQKSPVVYLLALFCCALWGSAIPCIKLGYAFMNISSDAPSSQILFAGIRFTLAGILTVILGSIIERKLLLPDRAAIPKLAWLALTQTILQYLFFYIGLAHAPGVKSSIINGSATFFALLVATYVFKQEKMTLNKFTGCLMGFSGLIICNLAGKGIDSSFVWNGEGFILLSALSCAISTVLIRRFSQGHSPVMLSGYQFIIGGSIMALCGFLLGGSFPNACAAGWMMILWLAFVSAVAYSLWGILLKHNPVSKVTIFGFSNPLFSAVLSTFLLGEKGLFNLHSFIALILVSLGIYIVNKN